MGLMKNLGRSGGRRGLTSKGVTIELRVDPVEQAKLEKAFKTLTYDVQNKIVPAAAWVAMKPVIKVARRYLDLQGQSYGETRGSGRTGTIAKSLGLRRKVYRRDGTTFVALGALPGFRDPNTGEDPQNIAHLLEFGTQPHAIGKGSKIRKGVQRGSMHPGARKFPFLRPALDSEKENVMRRYRSKLLKDVEREMSYIGGK